MRLLKMFLVLALALPAIAFDLQLGDAASADAATSVAEAGAAVVDASWHIGASGGQFSDDGPPTDGEAVDPHHHSTKKKSSYGLGSRVEVRALVVKDAQGEKVAIVSHDLYLPQDLLTRRIASLVEAKIGIPADHVMVTASHNHNSAFYSTPGWGTWLFQDVYDLRFFEYMAQRSLEAVSKANHELVPVRMGGSTTTFNEITNHTYGPKVSDEGTPAGQPYNHTTGELSVVAFDDMTDPAAPKPLATWVVFGVHPEWTWGYDLLNGDISHATTRIVDRDTGGVTVWSGREIGTSGPHKDTRAHEPEKRREYQDNGFAQMERAARMLADAVIDNRADIAAETPERPERYAAFDTDFDVATVSKRFAPPTTRPYPGVSNCNTQALFHGDPRIPIIGLPDCQPARDAEFVGDYVGPVLEPVQEVIEPIGAQMYDQLKEAGVPVPESYSATALTGVEETAAVHLMAVKLGDIGVTVCPCELFTDTALNMESRIDRVPDNLWIGWNWADQKTPAGRDWCVRNPDGTWKCADPRNPGQDLAPVSEVAYKRMIAQIENDAAGWETDLETLGSEAEPVDPAKIKGNFTHEEFPEFGFKLPIAVGMGNDYWGYMPEYREYRAHDHYRKALSGLGPHGADFLATRLSRLAVSLNGGPGPEIRPIDTAYQAESLRAQVMATGLGELATAYETAYQASLPADGGEPAIVSQPAVVKRFSAAHLEWIGGSTYADMPRVEVQRLHEREWVPYADTAGEVQLTVDFPAPEELHKWRAGDFEWKWTAAFETFGSDITLPDASRTSRTATPAGSYRFVVEGQHRDGPPGSLENYELVGEPFEVAPWDGITVEDMRVDADGKVSFKVGPVTTRTYPGGKKEVLGPIDVPDSYQSPFRYIKNERRVFRYGGVSSDRHQVYCSFCSFRPWADTAEVATAMVMIKSAKVRKYGGDSKIVTVPARYDPATGRWRTGVLLGAGQEAWIAQGGIVDSFGDVNGAMSSVVRR